MSTKRKALSSQECVGRAAFGRDFFANFTLSLPQISVEKSEDGSQAQVRYRIEEAGKYELSIKWFGEHIKVGGSKISVITDFLILWISGRIRKSRSMFVDVL